MWQAGLLCCITSMIAQDYIAEARRRAGEPLLPELEPYLVQSPVGVCLKHPWVFDVPHFPQLAWRCNDQYQAKREAVRQAREAKNWVLFLQLYERPYRRDALWEIRRQVSDQEYWELLGYVWTDSENIWQWGQKVRFLMGSQRPGRKHIMDELEQKALAALPDSVAIYRGLTSRGTRLGWSWTLVLDGPHGARWWSRRLLDSRDGEYPIVLKSTVAKSKIIAHFTRRSEQEIVVNPRDLNGVQELDVGQPSAVS